jgi:hypothetical protein
MLVTLCGSARFEKHFKRWNEALTLAGHCVFSLAVYPSDRGGKYWYTPEQKAVLDLVHRRKISASNAVVFLNADAYMGESTLSELDYALLIDKPCYFLESWGRGNGPTGGPTVGRGSPVDTTRFSSVVALLGDAGSLRSSLVQMLEAEDVL